MLSLFKKRLPHCDKLFRKFIAPWYPEKDRPDMTRPDMYVISGYQGKPLDLDALQYLPPEILPKLKEVIREMGNALMHDHTFLGSYSTSGLAFLDALDKYYNKKRVADLIEKSNPKDIENPYFVTVCELGAFLGGLFCENPKYGWLYLYPYFHSIVVEKETGIGITVFDWAVKKFSGYGIDDGLVAKFHEAHGIGVAEMEKVVIQTKK